MATINPVRLIVSNRYCLYIDNYPYLGYNHEKKTVELEGLSCRNKNKKQ